MDVRWIGFGEIEIEGRDYDHDVVIEAGEVRKRAKKASRAYKAEYGHTPLSAEEDLPLGGDELVVGTGASGLLPIMPAVEDLAAERGVRVVALPTPRALERLAEADAPDVFAVLHVTC